MILTCPDCATRYFVADDRIGPEGRTVRCASCGTKWTAKPEEPLELAASPEAGAVAEEPPPPPPEPAALSQLPGEELPRAFRERAQTRVKVREAATQGIIAAAVVGAVVVILGLGLILRQEVARAWPHTAGLYAVIGLPVNLVGLAIENQQAQPALRDGHAALVVSGSLRNIRDRAVGAPALRISLLNPAGKPVLVKIADPDGASIPPGEARRFSVDLLDPPVSATDVEIAFVAVGAHHKGQSGSTMAPPPVKTSLRGPTGVGPDTPPLTEVAPAGESQPPSSGSSTPPPTRNAPTHD